jgi:hypothetical protein
MRMSRALWSITELVLVLLAACIWVASTALAAASGFTAMVATTLLPGLAQVYWIAVLWNSTGAFPQPLRGLCVTWLSLFVVLIYARDAALREQRHAQG